MKSRNRLITACAALVLTGASFADAPNLPKVEILGKEYYFYEIKKGDSLYGIAKQFGWDPQQLVELNPGVAANLEKGARVYYPTGKVVVITSADASEDNAVEIPFDPITHMVEKGETAYSIAKRYNISLDTLYANHPSAKYGVKAGETITITQQANSFDKDGRFYYHTIKSGDTLYSLAKTYKTTVEKLLVANPGVTERNFRIGDTVRIPVGTDGGKRMKTVLVDERRVEAIDSYKAEKGDTWASIARQTGATEEDLRQANGGAERPAKDQTVAVPIIGTTQVEKQVEVSEDLGTGTVQELYDSIHGIEDINDVRGVRVQLLLDDPSSRRDSEFVKGFMLALNDYKDAPYKVVLKIDKAAAPETATASMNEFDPDIIISTSDRNFPVWIADYGKKNTIETINVFDVKNEYYTEYPQMVQILTPTSYFNEEVAQYLSDQFGGRILLLVGTPDDQDTMAEALKSAMKGVQLSATIDELAQYPFNITDSYLVYAYPTSQGEVEKMLNALAEAKTVSPGADISVVGRPNWITLTDHLGEKFHQADVYFPSRFYFDWEAPESKNFTESFTEQYGHAPVKSYPLYSAVGYDMANYFIPGVAVTEGDFNREIPDSTPLQTGVRLKRTSNWSGFYNPVCYLVRFTPYGTVEKTTVK